MRVETLYSTVEQNNSDGLMWPLDAEVIPNNMGINLCSVEGMEWGRREDGQLTYVTIKFRPDEE
ncbi:MAG: hypothetical protein GY941_22200 [Planctomycetes bacterium]|nr:hypothetical protein [Planctomycetota bacterium]